MFKWNPKLTKGVCVYLGVRRGRVGSWVVWYDERGCVLINHVAVRRPSGSFSSSHLATLACSSMNEKGNEKEEREKMEDTKNRATYLRKETRKQAQRIPLFLHSTFESHAGVTPLLALWNYKSSGRLQAGGMWDSTYIPSTVVYSEHHSNRLDCNLFTAWCSTSQS